MPRSVPMSRVRLATLAYIVIIAPMIAPSENTMLMVWPSTLMKLARFSDWSA